MGTRTLEFLLLVQSNFERYRLELGLSEQENISMLCFLCGKKIGLLRSLMDQQYCYSEHRKEARLASSQALRDEEDVETWAVAKSRERNKGRLRSAPSAGQTASIFAFLTVGALLVAAMLLPGPKPGAAFPAVSLDPSVKRGFFARAGDAVGEMIRSSTPITLRQTFPSGNLRAAVASVNDWATVRMASASKIDDPRDWLGKTRHSSSLRLWKSSASMHNYQMDFQGTLERTSLSWAFRASDNGNHYGAKLAILKPGPLPNAGLIRYSMVDGREFDRVQLPVPVTLERGVDYRITVSVQDDRFITYLNGRVISSWTDDRIHRGGVGFFDDPDDPQKVAWVSLSERDSFLGRMLAHFSLLLVPGEPLGY